MADDFKIVYNYNLQFMIYYFKLCDKYYHVYKRRENSERG